MICWIGLNLISWFFFNMVILLIDCVIRFMLWLMRISLVLILFWMLCSVCMMCFCVMMFSVDVGLLVMMRFGLR